MAVSPPVVEVAAAFVTNSPQTSASFSVLAGELLIVPAATTGATSSTGVLTASDITTTHTGIGSWTLVQVSNPGVTGTALYVFYAIASVNSTGTVTVSYSNATPAKAVLVPLSVPVGFDTTDPVDGFVGAAGTASTLSLVLTETPTADDLVIGFIVSRNDQSGIGVDADMTELVDAASANPSPTIQIQYDTGTTSTDVSWSDINTVHWSALAFIVRNASGGPPPTGTFYEWDGAALVPLTLLGEWDGAAIDPLTFKEIST